MLADPDDKSVKLQRMLEAFQKASTPTEKKKLLTQILDELKSAGADWPKQMSSLADFSEVVDSPLIQKFEFRRKNSSSGGDPGMLSSR